MNLAGNQAKQLFKSLRTGSPPSMVGFWAAATVVDQMRKRRGPKEELIVSRKLKPGQSYLIRVPGPAEGELASGIAPGSTVEEIDASGDGSIASQLMSAATDLIGAATGGGSEAAPSKRRSRARRSTAEEAPSKVRRTERREARLAELEEVDRSNLSRRRRRKLDRADRRAQSRPTRRRVRKAKRQQAKATRAIADATPSRRRRRKIRAAERNLELRRLKAEKRSTRRRRRKLRRAERDLQKLSR